jgi:uncharacterized phage protein (TIGR01671 family)
MFHCFKFRVWNKRENCWDDSVLLGVFNKDGILRHLYDHDAEYTVIQQYTGQNDLNGKDIYEGDIVELLDTHTRELFGRFKVIFSVAQFHLSVIEFPRNKRLWDGALISMYNIPIVIGNIFENPELDNQEVK